MKRLAVILASGTIGFLTAVAIYRGPEQAFICPEGTSPTWLRVDNVGDLPQSDVLACAQPGGNLHGPAIKWIGDEIWTVSFYRDGRLHGTSFGWDNGRRWIISDWDSGKMGSHSRWNSAGVMTHDAALDSQTGEEVTRSWYDGGQQKAEISWSRGRLNGPYRSWHPSGRLATEGQYRDGRPVGDWSCWGESGKSLRTQFDAEGRLVTRAPQPLADWMRPCTKRCGATETGEQAEAQSAECRLRQDRWPS
jgi:hypothetical protein